MSAPVTWSTGRPFAAQSTDTSRTTLRPMWFGRNGERVVNTPTRVLPPSFGGRTVGE